MSEVPTEVSAIDWSLWQPTDTATLCFVADDERILLIRKKRGLGAGKISAPGGRLDPGETPLQCATREVQEELCITPLGLRHGGEHRFQFVDGYALHVHVFTATGYEGIPQETEEALPIWTAVDAIPYDEMWADDRLWLPHLLAKRAFSGRWIFDGDRVVDYVLELGE